MTQWNIRTITETDAQSMIDILNPIIEGGKHTILDHAPTVEEEREFIRNFPDRGLCYGVFHPQTQEMAGFQNVEPFASYTRVFDHVGIIGTYVKGSFRQQGVASALFRNTFEAAASKGYEKLFAYVRGDNPIALQTYLKQGFQNIGTAKKHAKINGSYIDEIMIEKLL